MSSSQDYICPFCGNIPSKKGRSSYEPKEVEGSVSPAGLGGKAKFREKNEREFYYDCSGCNNQYEDISDRDFKSILDNLKIATNVKRDLVLVYGKSKLGEEVIKQLFNSRTGIVRPKKDRGKFFVPYVKELVGRRQKEELIICLNFNTIRRYVKCLKKTDKYNREYYEAVSVGVP
jgi:hypothetical protein